MNNQGLVLRRYFECMAFVLRWMAGQFYFRSVRSQVAFRGVIDPDLEGAGTGRLQAWCSAVYGSILGSVWHLPGKLR